MPDLTPLLDRRLFVGSYPVPGPGWRERVDVIYFVAVDIPPPRSSEYPGVRLRYYPFSDEVGMTGRDRKIALRAAEHVAHDLGRGRRVLVTCRMGRNRSALVCALALHLVTGKSGVECARLVQSRRVDPSGVRALQNRAFVELLAQL